MKDRTQKVIATGDSGYIYQKELDKVCFQQDMGYGDFKDLTRRPASDKILCLEYQKRSCFNGLWIFLIKRIQAEQLKMMVFLIKS